MLLRKLLVTGSGNAVPRCCCCSQTRGCRIAVSLCGRGILLLMLLAAESRYEGGWYVERCIWAAEWISQIDMFPLCVLPDSIQLTAPKDTVETRAIVGVVERKNLVFLRFATALAQRDRPRAESLLPLRPGKVPTGVGGELPSIQPNCGR